MLFDERKLPALYMLRKASESSKCDDLEIPFGYHTRTYEEWPENINDDQGE